MRFVIYCPNPSCMGRFGDTCQRTTCTYGAQAKLIKTEPIKANPLKNESIKKSEAAGRWSEEEVARLRNEIEHTSKNWNEIAVLFSNRSLNSVTLKGTRLYGSRSLDEIRGRL